MDRDTFKMIHSELIQQVQGIEYDLKLIYAAMKSGDFDENYGEVKEMSLGTITKELKRLDNRDNMPDLSNKDYETIDRIRHMRNYWCHQCYVDFMYIQDDDIRENKFQEIARKLSYDENNTWDLFQKLEAFRIKEIKRYNR